MRYVRIWADTHSTGMIDERGASIPLEQTSLCQQTWAELRKWVDDYDHVIPLDEVARVAIRGEIEDLDARGIRLFKKIGAEWPFDESGEPIGFAYFSEGRQTLLATYRMES